MHAERDIVLPMLSISICPSVRQMLVLCHVITLFRLCGRGIILDLSLTAVREIQGNPSSEALNVQKMENFANIALYLENGTR